MNLWRVKDALKTSLLLFSYKETSTKINIQANKTNTNMVTNLIRYKLVHKNEHIGLT